MSKKRMELELVNDIDSLVIIQERTLRSFPANTPKAFIDYQKDILRVLKVMQQLDIFNTTVN